MTDRTPQPDHAEIMYALGALHSDMKAVHKGIDDLRLSVNGRLAGHSERLTSLETTRTRIWAYAAGVSAGAFTLGTVLKDKITTVLSL